MDFTLWSEEKANTDHKTVYGCLKATKEVTEREGMVGSQGGDGDQVPKG